METLQQFLTEYGPPTLKVLVFVIVGWIAGGWIGRLVVGALQKAKVEVTLARFLGNMARWAVLVLAGIACLSIFGAETTSFAAIIGAAALGIGLAFQGSLSNLAAGVMLLIFRPFKVDDVVRIGGELGKVSEISLFTTELDTFDNRRIILPNASVFGAVIENLTHHPTRRVDVAVGVAYPADLDRTREVLLKGALSVPNRVEDVEPQVILTGLGNSSVDWQVRVWCKTEDYWTIRDATTRAAKMALDEAGIGIPFPQMDVHLDTPTPAIT